MKLIAMLGWLLFVVVIVNFLAGYGTRWQFGERYGMPKSLLGPDGKHLDGSEVDDVTLTLVRRDIEEESYLVALGILLVLSTVAAFELRRLYRLQRKVFGHEPRRNSGMPPRDNGRE